MKIKIILIILGLFAIFYMIIGGVSADVSVGYNNNIIYTQNTKISLVVYCINNGTICSNAAVCNLTVQYPNETYMVNFQPMTINNGDLNYTLPDSSAIGIFPAKVVCCDNIICGTSIFNINITPTGDVNNLGLYIMLIIIILGILLVGVFIRNIPITLIGGLCAMAFGVYTTIYGFATFNNIGTQILSVGILAFGAYWTADAGLEQLDIL